MGVRAFWRDIGEPIGTLAEPRSLWQAIRDAGKLRYLDGGGVGCINEDERPTDRRKIYHHLTFYGFLLCFASTSVATLYHYLLGARGALSVVRSAGGAGHAGGIGLLIGPSVCSSQSCSAIRCWSTQTRLGMDVAFIVMLFLTGLTGMALLLLRETAAMGPAAGAASRRGVRAVHHHALRQVRARPLPLRRAGPICAGAADDGGVGLTAIIRPPTQWEGANWPGTDFALRTSTLSPFRLISSAPAWCGVEKATL